MKPFQSKVWLKQNVASGQHYFSFAYFNPDKHEDKVVDWGKGNMHICLLWSQDQNFITALPKNRKCSLLTSLIISLIDLFHTISPRDRDIKTDSTRSLVWLSELFSFQLLSARYYRKNKNNFWFWHKKTLFQFAF